MGAEAPKNIDEIMEGIMGGGCCPLRVPRRDPAVSRGQRRGGQGSPQACQQQGASSALAPTSVCPSP